MHLKNKNLFDNSMLKENDIPMFTTDKKLAESININAIVIVLLHLLLF